MNDFDKEWKEIFNEIKVREITKEDRLFIKYSILLFLRIYIDNPPESDGIDESKITMLKNFLEIISNQAALISDELADELATKALKCGKIEEFTTEKTTNKLIH